MAEFMARLLGPPFEWDESELGQCDRLVGWRGQPNMSTELKTAQYEHQVTWNSRGMRDREHNFEKEEGIFRILVLGDSFIEALQVEDNQTSHSVLEEKLNDLAPPHIRFEVIGAGIRGWGPVQEYMYFHSEGKSFHPDLVLVYWFPANDLLDILPDYRVTFGGINCYAPYFAICDEQFDPTPWFVIPGLPSTGTDCSAAKKIVANALNRLYYSSRLYQRLEPVLTKGYGRLSFSPNYLPWFEQAHTNEVLNFSYQLTGGVYRQLADEADQTGAKTAFIIVPAMQAVYSEIDPAYRAVLEAGMPGLGEANPTLPNQIFTELMTARELTVLDLHPYFTSHLKDGGELLYIDTDFHWNVAGNRKAAELIAAWLIDQELTPITP